MGYNKDSSAVKCYFRHLNELQTEKFFKGVPLKFEAASFELIKFFLRKILFPDFTGSEPETNILSPANSTF